MNDFTYEQEERQAKLETYEWDNVWWEQAADEKRPRILYVGDSISCGIRRYATMLSKEQLLFDGFGTSKSVDHECFEDSLRLFCKQQKKRAMIIFNNGLHGWHLEDMEEYGKHYERMVRFFLKEYPETPLALILTTSTQNIRRERVILRNETVKKIAQKYALPIIDLYTPSVEYRALQCEDGVHFTEEGYEKFAEVILEEIAKLETIMV